MGSERSSKGGIDERTAARDNQELLAWAEAHRVTTFLLEAFDEPWKGEPTLPGGAEKHWGLWTVEREAKETVGGSLTPARR
jgi:exo-beta-1,3-glucanase (GH17 family)